MIYEHAPTIQKSIAKLKMGDVIQEGNYITGFTRRTFVKVDPVKEKGQRWRRITISYDSVKSYFNTGLNMKFNVIIFDPQNIIEGSTGHNI